MTVTKFPNGVSSFGVPLMGSSGMIPATTGTYYFVHSGSGDNSDDGLSPTNALATVDAAVGKCSANAGDVIIVMPGHSEAISSGTSLVVDVSGVQIIGLGHGHSRPKFIYDNTAGSIEMNAGNTRLSNVSLFASVSAIEVAINVNASDVTLDNLETTFEATGDDFKIIVDVDAFDRCTITDCRFFSEPTVAGGVTTIRVDDSHNLVFQRNLLIGNSAIMFNMVGALSNDCVITDNYMYNSDTTDNSCWEITVASTGIFARNCTGSLFATGIANALDPGSMLCVENYFANAIDESDILLPSTTPT